jgi:GNAT superfamily N-acetyltransferase
MSKELTPLSETDQNAVFEVINAAAEAYEGEIPDESDTTPYMSMDEVETEMGRIQFYGDIRDRLVGVIGIQERQAVSLVRHLYVRPERQRQGVGTALLEGGIERADSQTVLVGTWAAAEWALEFYESNGFENLGTDRELLARHWEIPSHQIAASVVLRYEKGK